MSRTIEQNEWSKFLREYSDRNHGRPTRLGVFQVEAGATNDYWIEDGLPLIAVDAYMNRGQVRIDLLFENFTHSIEGASNIVCLRNGDANDGLDISDSEGTTTQLRFEDWPDQKE